MAVVPVPQAVAQHYEDILTGLYGQKPTGAAIWRKRRAALALLDRLRAKVPELSGGRLDLEELIPRVLMFEQGRVVMPEDEQDLMKAAMADEVRNASRLATVSAFYLVRKGCSTASTASPFPPVIRAAGTGIRC